MGSKVTSRKEVEKMYGIVEKLRKYPKENSRNKKMYNFTDPTALRALRIHRHLKALENDILESTGTLALSLSADPSTESIVISIRNEAVHCNRVAYLTTREFRLLRKNRKVANILRKCPEYKDVA